MIMERKVQCSSLDNFSDVTTKLVMFFLLSFTSESERFKLKQNFSNFINALQIFDASNILMD